MALTKIRGNTQVQNLTVTNAQIANKDASNPDGILLSKIQDGDLLVKSDGSVGFTAPVTGIAPTLAGHLATKGYVDSVSQGLDAKASVRVIARDNIALTGVQTIDGVPLAAGDRVLVAGQDNEVYNGIYVVADGAWTRALDATTNDTVTSGLFTFVEEGTEFHDTGWVLASDGPTTLGTTPLPFVQFSAAGQVTAGDGIARVGNDLSVVAATDSGLEVTAAGVGIKLDGATLDVGPDGLKIADVGGGQLLMGDETGAVRGVTLSGDVTIDENGVATISAGAVGAASITDGSLALRKLVSGTAGQLIIAGASGAPTYVTPSGDVTIATTGAIELVAGSVGTPELAAGAVTAAKVAVDAIGTDAIVDGAVTANKLGALSVGTAALADDSVTAAKLADNAVDTPALVDGAVTEAKLDTGSVTAPKLAEGAVGTVALAPEAVTADKLAANAVQTVNIAGAAVTTAKLADESVTLTKLAPLAEGTIIMGTAGGNAAVTLSGDVTVTAAGVVSINPATVVRVADIVKGETPAGDINGANTTFTLAAAPKEGTVDVFVNGILQDVGAGNDYTIAGDTITMAYALTGGDKIRVSYFR